MLCANSTSLGQQVESSSSSSLAARIVAVWPSHVAVAGCRNCGHMLLPFGAYSDGIVINWT